MKVEIESRNPFWFFVPNEGKIDDWGYGVLRRYLKEEDIPSSVDGQLDVLLSKAETRGVSGGNGGGKTAVSTVDGIIKSIGELPKSLEKHKEHFEETIQRTKSKFIRGRVTAVDNKQLHRVVLETWKKFVPHEYLKDGIWEKSYSKEFDVLTLYRKGKACSSVEFLTNEQAVQSSQGSELDWAKFDEEPDRDKWKETLMRFRTADKLDMEIAWTPTEGLSWSTDLFHHGIFEDQEDTTSKELFKLTSVANPYVKDTITKIMDEFQKVSTYDEMKMRLLGEAISLSGLVYGSLFNHNIHVIEPFDTRCNCGSYRNSKQHSNNCPVSKYLVRVGCDPHLVTPTAAVFIGVDRMGNYYVFNSYMPSNAVDTEIVKSDIHKIVRENHYRWGQTIIDKSSNSDIEALGGLNIFRELSRGKFALRGVKTSEKHEGSIKAGVDEIKKLLKDNPITKKPRFFIFNTPENKPLINSFRTLERDTYKNESKQGQKDRIAEGKHHLHAALRYCFQYSFSWIPENPEIKEPVEERWV